MSNLIYKLYGLFLFFQVYNFIFPIKPVFLSAFGFLFGFVFVLVVFVVRFICISRSSFLPQVLIFTIVLAVFAIISNIINQSDDYLPIVQVFKYFWVFLVAYCIVLELKTLYPESFDKKLIPFVVFSGFIVGVTCILEFFIPEFKAFINSVIDTSGNIDYEESFRAHGLAPSGGASLSVCLSIIFSIALGKIAVSRLGYLSYFYAFVIFCSLFFVGRTGLFVALFLFLFMFFFRFGLLSVLKVTAVLFLLVFFFLGEMQEDHLNIIYSYSLEPVKNFIENGEFTSSSTSHWGTMFFLPDIFHFLFGGGYWRFPIYPYELSDIGYIKTLMAFGVFGAIVFYAYNAWLYFYSAKAWAVREGGFCFSMFFPFFILFLVEFKEAFLIQNYSFKLMALLIVSSFFIRGRG